MERDVNDILHLTPTGQMALSVKYCGKFGFLEEKTEREVMGGIINDIPFAPHDLRRTLRTRLAEIGIDDVVAERVLGHKLQGIMAVYNRHSYNTEKRQSLDKWANKLRRIVGVEEPEFGKVIQMRVAV